MILAQRHFPLSDCEDGVPSGAGGVSTRGGGAGADCQQGADTKAFKGKGGSGRSLADVQAEMRKLADETKSIAGRLFFLEVHRRRQTGQISLRWRLVTGRWRHVKWEDQELQLALSRSPLVWRGWYTQMHGQALLLNREERELRAALREVVATPARV